MSAVIEAIKTTFQAFAILLWCGIVLAWFSIPVWAAAGGFLFAKWVLENCGT